MVAPVEITVVAKMLGVIRLVVLVVMETVELEIVLQHLLLVIQQTALDQLGKEAVFLFCLLRVAVGPVE